MGRKLFLRTGSSEANQCYMSKVEMFKCHQRARRPRQSTLGVLMGTCYIIYYPFSREGGINPYGGSQELELKHREVREGSK